MMPLYEAKMMGAYDHRSADVVKSATAGKRQNQPRYLTDEDHTDPSRAAMPLSWVPEAELPQVGCWLTGFSDVTSSTNERTVLAGILPTSAVGHTYPLYLATQGELLTASFNSAPLDYIARQKVAGLHLTYGYVKQFPVLPPEEFSLARSSWSWAPMADWLHPRILELTYTAYDIAPFAEDLRDVDAHGKVNPPFVWDDERRSWLRAELDAAFFHLYGIERDEVDHIMDTFPIVRRKDEAAHGEYRTKNRIMGVYDAMQAACDTGQPYQSVLSPLPGDGPRHPQQTRERPRGPS